ncbi:unnamed protein product [Hermetia illucens]|uniref:NAD(P)-binding domain-containing protein n=1 Tax=Hermetia illucens TaxID=343691 RepID=A0A7R8UXG3_HERIL|nr:unnamed protein product [Hermetia illucens]
MYKVIYILILLKQMAIVEQRCYIVEIGSISYWFDPQHSFIENVFYNATMMHSNVHVHTPVENPAFSLEAFTWNPAKGIQISALQKFSAGFGRFLRKNGRNDQRQRAAKGLNEPVVEDVVVYGRTNDTESKVNWTIIRPGPIKGPETGVPAEFYEASPQQSSMKTGYLDIGIYDRYGQKCPIGFMF